MNPDMNLPTVPPPTRTQMSNTCPRTQPKPHGCRPPILLYGTPRRTKQAGQPHHQSEATSQSALHTARPRPPRWSPMPPQLTDQALKPGTRIQGNPNDPERAEKPAPDNPPDPNLYPSPDPNQKARSLSWPPTPDGKRGTGPENRPKTSQTPILSPNTQSPARRSHGPPTKRSQPEACAARPNYRKKSGPAGRTQPEYATQRRAHDQHAQPPPNHGAEPTECPVPDAWQRTTATTRQAGQQNTSHTKGANKKHPTQNGRPTQMQAPGQHRHMHAPQTNEPRPPWPTRKSSRPRDAPPRPPPCPREIHQPSKQKGDTERPHH
ncbi:hypothetical protein ILYODFUR_029739, partial [Ilyodon furcidens]